MTRSKTEEAARGPHPQEDHRDPTDQIAARNQSGKRAATNRLGHRTDAASAPAGRPRARTPSSTNRSSRKS